jgi:small-conductance mechanosensitive channel
MQSKAPVPPAEPQILFSVALIAAALAVGLLLHFIFQFVLKRWHHRASAGRKGPKIELRHLRAPLRSLIPAVCFAITVPFLRFPKEINPVLNHAAELWIIASVGWLVVKAVDVAREAILSEYELDVKDNLRARRMYTQVRVARRVIVAVVVVVSIGAMLMTFASVRQFGVSLLASAGVIGIIIGFAAQKTLGNLMAGIQIAFAQPIRLDDVLVVEKEWGWVEEITLTYVVVRIWDLRRLVLPISYFIEHPFQNWTRTSADILGTVYLYADYSVRVQDLRDELTRILEQSPNWDRKVNVLQVTGLTDKTVEIRALMSAADSPTAWNLRCEVREKLLAFLQMRRPEDYPRTRVELVRDAVPSGAGE